MGKPIIRGTRITVEQILENLAANSSIDDILTAHPHLTKEQIHAALAFAAEWLSSRLRVSSSRSNGAILLSSMPKTVRSVFQFSPPLAGFLRVNTSTMTSSVMNKLTIKSISVTNIRRGMRSEGDRCVAK
jgi:uncharacterized protein (DUF433 family)